MNIESDRKNQQQYDIELLLKKKIVKSSVVLPLRYSVVLSSTRFNNGSKPLRIPEHSLPPANLTLITLSRNLERSKMLSLRFLSLFSPPAS